MKPIPPTASLLLTVLLAACGDPTPDEATAPPSTLPQPTAIIAALPPEAQPYGLDVYTLRCAGCHGNLGEGIDKAPTLRNLSRVDLFQRAMECRAARLADNPAAVMPLAVAQRSEAEIAAAAIYAGE
ncbi:MAG TPA: hypothetical protein PKC12_00295 [Thiobacillaceae bacterium]|nr:hypothetical protein [Thiobacillaceae bacterium]